MGAREQQQQQARSRVTIPLLLQPTARVLRACRGQLQWVGGFESAGGREDIGVVEVQQEARGRDGDLFRGAEAERREATGVGGDGIILSVNSVVVVLVQQVGVRWQ